MDPADDSSDLSHLCSSALDLLKRFDNLLNNKHKPDGNTYCGVRNPPSLGHSCCGVSRSQQPLHQQPSQYSCKGDAAAAGVVSTCQQCDSVKRQQRRVEKKPVLSQEKKALGLPQPPSMLSLAAAATNEIKEAAPENSNNAASSSWQLTRLQPTELRLILKLDTWMTSDGSLVVRPSVYEDRAAVSIAASKAEELAAQRFSASTAGKQLMQPFRGPPASVKMTGNHRCGDTDETDGHTIVIPLCRQQLLQQKQLQLQQQQEQQQQLQQLQLQQHLQLQQLIEAQQQQQQKQPQLLYQRQSHLPLPTNLVGPSLRNISNNQNGTPLPSKTILLPVSTSSVRRSVADGVPQTSGATLYKRRGAAVDSYLPQGTAPCLCGAAATADDGCCQVNNHHDNSNSESDNLSDQSDAINNSFGSDYSFMK